MFSTARPASDGPARSCTLAYTSTNLRSVSTVQKKSIRGKLKEYRGRSAFTFVPLAAVRSTATSTSGPTTMALPLGHLRTLIFHRRPCRYGNSPDILGSICRKACSTFPRRVFSRLFAWRSRPRQISQETASGPLMGWSGRAPAPPVIEAGSGHRRQGARHVSEIQLRNRRDRHRYRQELVPHRGPRSARRNRAAAEVVTRPGRSTARQPATVLNRYGGLRRRASSQSQAPNAWPRRPTDAREIRAPLFEGTEE